MKNTLLCGILLSLLWTSPSRADGLLSLDQALSEGSQSSPQLQKAEAASKEASWKQTEALSGFLPSLNLQASHYFSEKYVYTDLIFGNAPVSVPGIFPTSSATVNLTVPVFEGFASMNRYSAAELNNSAAKRNYDWTRFQVEQDISLKFYQALAAQKTLEVAQQNLTTITDHLKQVQALKKSGVATRYDVLRVEVQTNEAQSELLQAEDNVAMARQKLAIVMGMDHDDRELSGDLPTPEIGKIKNLKATDLQQRTDILAMSEQTEAAHKAEKAASSYWVPRFDLGGQYIYYNNLSDGISDYDKYRSAYSVGVFMTWNLFDGMASISRSKESAFQRVQAEKALKQVQNQLPYDFDFWKRRSVYSATLYNAKKSDLEKSQESVRLAQEGFRAGTKTNTEVLDAAVELFRARAGVVNSQMNFLEAQINLELALGRRL